MANALSVPYHVVNGENRRLDPMLLAVPGSNMEALWKTVLDWVFHILPAFLIRWYWTEERLRSKIILDIRPRGDALDFRGGERSEIAVYIRVWNMAPFQVEVDRLEVAVSGSGLGEVCQPLRYIQKTTVPPAAFADIFVRGGEGVDLEKRLANANAWPTADITIRAEVVSRVRTYLAQTSDGGFVRPMITGISNELRQKLFR